MERECHSQNIPGEDRDKATKSSLTSKAMGQRPSTLTLLAAGQYSALSRIQCKLLRPFIHFRHGSLPKGPHIQIPSLSHTNFLVTSCTEAIMAPLWSPQPPRPGQGHLHCSARPRSHTPSPCFPFFYRAQGILPLLPASTAAAGHSPLCLGRVLLLLVFSLLTHRAFQRAELSPIWESRSQRAGLPLC